jgi:hypothetical protein
MKTLIVLMALSACASTTRDPGSSGSRFGEVVRRDSSNASLCASGEGDTCRMTWDQASAYCTAQGGHLPTAREYARLLAPRGSRILELAEVTGTVPPGYYLVASVNPNGERDDFYMNHEEYRRPEGEKENLLLWTASVPPTHPQYAHVYYNEWGGGGGDPRHHRKDYPNSVQCVF